MRGVYSNSSDLLYLGDVLGVTQEGRKGKRVIGETVQLDISDFALLPKLFGKQ